ncbi:6-phosphogluconolactonase [Arthrobacter stackebrandtii]|uniref:6-phosphogluconolactonase n=1 Tax=Arthrobacter stackebrandtii TaxID=272161 RepID=A0ABS4YRJ0_9MICC|nr:beta-propeller fold lactonase family protein [Arthrobacter stackebrandtii]MBP2411379.1 6-phosphogluconolactonase [Arthrobacter stackebrandtii]PYH00328.1 hypothetical protein CVV67_11320 [Arthrobacter stackebrandtii]
MSEASIIVSGYTEEGYGSGPGMVRFAMAADGLLGEKLATASAVLNPSFVADGGTVVLAVEESGSGSVVALDPDSLAVEGRAASGADSCHVALVGADVWAANYTDGTASITPLAALLGGAAPQEPETVSHPGSGPVADRQGESHAHQVTATTWGTVLVADLGSDRVDEYSASSRVRLGSAELPPGTGPRHVALKDGFMLVAGELDGHLHVLQRAGLDGGTFWHWLFKVPLAESSGAVAAAEQFYPSHIQLSDDGTLLYSAVRGPNTLVVLDVSGLNVSEGADTAPTPPRFVAEVPSGGNWPRHFALSAAGGDNGMLYVANQLSSDVTVFELDQNGIPGAAPVQTIEFGSPACILIRP